MKTIALILLVVFTGLALYNGFIYGSQFIDQLCWCLLIGSFLCYTEKYSYINIILFGLLCGAGYELIDEGYKLNDGGVLPSDKLFTALWVTITVFRVGYKITKKWR